MLAKLNLLLNNLKTKLTNFQALAKKDLYAIWEENKTVLILLGGVILTIKFRQLVIDFLIKSAKQLLQKTQKQDQSDQLKEDADNNAANALIKQAEDLPNEEQPVDPDWYKK